MSLVKIYSEILLTAEGKALATYGEGGVNVVPVSTIRLIGEEIVLVNYFLNKTLSNLKANPEVALACWKGFAGYQIKGQARYETEGEIFDEIVVWIKEILPDRTVKGIIVIKPAEVFDITASSTRAGQVVG